jgi:transcription elongation factor GreA
MDDSGTTLTGGLELMRSLGLSVDGPAQWGKPPHGRAPGVFVVELPGGADSAPIDSVALRHWIEHVPGMLLDGEPPTVKTLRHRLASFWLRGEPILYVGFSARSIASRVAAMYATELGDARPWSGAHWLKTLAVLPRLRVWWAETDAHEEYADALLSEIAARQAHKRGTDEADPTARLPFANLAASTGERRRHGLENSLRAETSPQPTAKARASRRAPPSHPSTVARTSTARARSNKAAEAPSQPRGEPRYVSRDGLDRLTAELDELRSVARPQIIARVKAARELGDLRENADYEYARKEQSFVEGRIQALEALLRTGVVIDEPGAGDTVQLGSTVVVEADGHQSVFVLVGSAEADASAGRISHRSPVGAALLNARVGDEVSVQLPRGSLTYHVRAIR